MVADVGQGKGGNGRGRREITEEDFRRLHPKLLAAFRQLGCGREESRDLTQETLLRAHRNLGSFRQRAQLDTWVVSIGKKVWLQHVRDQNRLKRSASEISLETARSRPMSAPSIRSHEAVVIAKDAMARLDRSIRRLPEDMQQALTLHARGHKYREIAGLMGVPENRVSSLIYQARQRLRRELQD